MKRTILILSLITVILSSCKKDAAVNNATQFNATVLGRGMDCGDAYLIEFNDNVVGLPENAFGKLFYEINLPAQLKVAGQKIKVEFRTLQNKEGLVCTAQGPGYPAIFITKAE